MMRPRDEGEGIWSPLCHLDRCLVSLFGSLFGDPKTVRNGQKFYNFAHSVLKGGRPMPCAYGPVDTHGHLPWAYPFAPGIRIAFCIPLS